MYCAVIGDFIDSKKIEPEKRKSMQDRLQHLLERINCDYKDSIAANFLITLGDEFQGLMISSWPAVEIIELLIREFYPQKIRFGVGLGDIYTRIDSSRALGADGPAYHMAREAISELKNSREETLAFFPVRFKTQNCDEKIMDALSASISVFMSGWTEKQRELVFKANEFGGQQRLVADAFGKNPSTVARGLKSAHYEQFNAMLKALREYLLERYDTACEKDNPENAMSFYNAGLYFSENEDFDEALVNFEKALQLSDENDPVTGKALYNLGKVCRIKGDCERALELYQKALALAEKASDPSAPEVALLYNALGLTYLQKGDCGAAAGYFKKALTHGLEHFPRESPNIALIYSNMGVVLTEQREAEQALGFFQKALEIQEKVLGSEHPDTASTYDNIGYAFLGMGEEERASGFFLRALEIRRKLLGKDHLLTASSYNNVGEVWRRKGEYDKALNFYGRALAVQERVLGGKHPAVAATYNNMGLAFFRKGEPEKALACYEKALSIFDLTPGNPANRKKVCANLAEYYEKQGDTEKALRYRQAAG